MLLGTFLTHIQLGGVAILKFIMPVFLVYDRHSGAFDAKVQPWLEKSQLCLDVRKKPSLACS
jgi:hypothetical protein